MQPPDSLQYASTIYNTRALRLIYAGLIYCRLLLISSAGVTQIGLEDKFGQINTPA